MSSNRPLQVLAKLRQMQSDQSRSALVSAAENAEAAEVAVRDLWVGAPIPSQDDAAADVRIRGVVVQSTRLHAGHLKNRVKNLEAIKHILQEKAVDDLVACRQIEILLEQSRKEAMKACHQREQNRADELALLRQNGPAAPFKA